jgi:hypothetical protein
MDFQEKVIVETRRRVAHRHGLTGNYVHESDTLNCPHCNGNSLHPVHRLDIVKKNGDRLTPIANWHHGSGVQNQYGAQWAFLSAQRYSRELGIRIDVIGQDDDRLDNQDGFHLRTYENGELVSCCPGCHNTFVIPDYITAEFPASFEWLKPSVEAQYSGNWDISVIEHLWGIDEGLFPSRGEHFLGELTADTTAYRLALAQKLRHQGGAGDRALTRWSCPNCDGGLEDAVVRKGCETCEGLAWVHQCDLIDTFPVEYHDLQEEVESELDALWEKSVLVAFHGMLENELPLYCSIVDDVLRIRPTTTWKAVSFVLAQEDGYREEDDDDDIAAEWLYDTRCSSHKQAVMEEIRNSFPLNHRQVLDKINDEFSRQLDMFC